MATHELGLFEEIPNLMDTSISVKSGHLVIYTLDKTYAYHAGESVTLTDKKYLLVSMDAATVIETTP